MSSLKERIDAVLRKETVQGDAGAAVAVLRDGAVVHCKGYGLANVELGVPISPDTVFHIASITKQFTAVAIMMLCERGLVKLDEVIGTYLDVPVEQRVVTLRQLLNHTAGIQNYNAVPSFNREAARLHTPLDDLLKRIAALAFDFAPGERYSYSNTGYVLLGAIIERISGKTYADFLRAEIFEPLGMTRTLYLQDQPIVKDRAAGYQRWHGILENAFFISATTYHAAGGLGSTVRDLALWDRAIRSNRLIRPETLAAMLESTTLNDGTLFPYGFGWGTGSYHGRRVFHHTGGINGFAAHMLHFRDQDLTTILLSNFSVFFIDRVTRGLARAALGLPEPSCVPHALTPGQRYAVCGAFRAEGIPVREIVATADGVALKEPNGAMLLARDETHFFEQDDPEIAYAFGDFREGKYGSFVYSSPLWPETVYSRVG